MAQSLSTTKELCVNKCISLAIEICKVQDEFAPTITANVFFTNV